MSNIIKNENARPATFGSAVDQLFRHNLDRWFDDQFWGFSGLQTRSGVPVNVREQDQSYEVEVIAPGLKKEDFQLQFNGDALTVSFERKEENNQQADHDRWLRREYRKQSFTRTFTIDDTVDIDKAVARYEDGILHVSLPKKTHAVKSSRTIAVQ
ncbi:MAG: Hsp20/alpha crystallin family protein [Bacteroidetes bacterium]|nr:Hsp20/alpha crystallin family protein [Bacteroidota bacterium]